MKKLHFGQKVFETAIVQGISMVGLFGINIIVARALGPSGKGALSLATYVPSVLFVVSNFGLYFATMYFWGRKNESIHKLLTNAVVFSLFISLLTVTLFIFFFPTFQNVFFKGVDSRLLFYAMIAIPFLQLDTTFDNFLLMREKVRYYNGISVLKIILQVCLVTILLVALNRGVYAALAAWVIAQGFSVIFTGLKVFRVEKIHFDFDLRLLLRTLGFGIRGYVGNMIYFLNKRLDLVLVAAFLSLQDVGIYSVALALTEVLFQLPSAITALLFPRVSSSSDRESNDFTPRIFRNTLLVMILLGAAAALLAGPFVALFFGGKFVQAIPPFYIIVPGVVLIGSTSVLGNDLAARGKLVIHSIIAFVALIINIVLNTFLVPRYGLMGAALASTLAFSFISIFTIILFHKITKASYRSLLIPRKKDFEYYWVFIKNLRPVVPAARDAEEIL